MTFVKETKQNLTISLTCWKIIRCVTEFQHYIHARLTWDTLRFCWIYACVGWFSSTCHQQQLLSTNNNINTDHTCDPTKILLLHANEREKKRWFSHLRIDALLMRFHFQQNASSNVNTQSFSIDDAFADLFFRPKKEGFCFAKTVLVQRHIHTHAHTVSNDWNIGDKRRAIISN